VSTYQTRLAGREPIAHGTMAFHLDKPPGFAFKPGQAIDVVLADAPVGDVQSTRHTFSIVSAPFENELVVATRLRDSPYKRALGSLPVGARLDIEGPFGSLRLHEDPARPAVLIAGGIGITPFISMLRQAMHDRLAQQIVLVYSNRRPEDAAFLAELQQLQQRSAQFRLIATMTSMSSSALAWDGPTGQIDEALVRQVASGVSRPIYYVVGPPAMAEAIRQTLNDAGVDDDDIRSEEFYGY